MAVFREVDMMEAHDRVERALSERDGAVLAFEGARPRHDSAKEQAIRAEFGVSSARYYQWLDALILRPEALRAEPMLVSRLLRLRQSRVDRRAARSALRRGAPR